MKIGVGIPCHINDRYLLPTCLYGVENLDPEPYKVKVDVNRGETGLKGVRTRLFNHLFESCDVILQCSVDFYLFPDTLKHVHPKKVTSFARLVRNPNDVSRIIARFISRHPWTGCYSLPKEVWRIVEKDDRWDGTDGSVLEIINRDYVFVYRPKHYLLRSSVRSKSQALEQKTLFKKLRKLFMRAF